MEMPAAYRITYAEGLAWPADELDTASKRELDGIIVQVKKRYSAVDSLSRAATR